MRQGYLLLADVLQLLAIFFTFFTVIELRFASALELVEAEGAALPFESGLSVFIPPAALGATSPAMRTCSPTCDDRSEVSPCSEY